MCVHHDKWVIFDTSVFPICLFNVIESFIPLKSCVGNSTCYINKSRTALVEMGSGVQREYLLHDERALWDSELQRAWSEKPLF